MVKIINLPYYLSHFIKNNPLFDVDLFCRTFDMESPSCDVCLCPSCPPFMWYIVRPILPQLTEVGYPKFLEIRNPWGKVLERSGLRIEHFCWEGSKIAA